MNDEVNLMRQFASLPVKAGERVGPMVYLLADLERRVLKVGYTKNLIKRMGHYQSHNPFLELYWWGPGSRVDEAYLLSMCKGRFQLANGKEWFVLDDAGAEWLINLKKQFLR